MGLYKALPRCLPTSPWKSGGQNSKIIKLQTLQQIKNQKSKVKASP